MFSDAYAACSLLVLIPHKLHSAMAGLTADPLEVRHVTQESSQYVH